MRLTNDPFHLWCIPHKVQMKPYEMAQCKTLYPQCINNKLHSYTSHKHNLSNIYYHDKLQWNLNRNLYIFIRENTFEDVVWQMAAILSRPQCVSTFEWWTHMSLKIICAVMPEYQVIAKWAFDNYHPQTSTLTSVFLKYIATNIKGSALQHDKNLERSVWSILKKWTQQNTNIVFEIDTVFTVFLWRYYFSGLTGRGGYARTLSGHCHIHLKLIL